MTDNRARAIERVIRAVLVAGPAPEVHRRQIQRLAAEWPALARGLADLMDAYAVPAPKEWR